ncbi:MAG: GNAT family N-acetyltransferase [Pseudomonadota bacterium]|nr:GNAT family N-acetyltransferase [Pseudomonadota bacterium]
MDGDSFTLDLATSIGELPAADWNRLAGGENPFVSHEFLHALEAGGATGGDSGWDPMHLVLRDSEGRLAAAMPHYLKHHSYGEYIFDHSWANAFMRAGGTYYPKMLSAVPFTPATGPRFLTGGADDSRAERLRGALAEGMTRYLDQFDLSSAHINFLPETDTGALAAQGWMIRSSIQFHWRNDGYDSFDGFLDALSSRKRKNIRKERRTVAESGVRLLRLTGDDLTAAHIDDFYRFYMSTIDRKWGGAYLTSEVFHILRQTMADRMLLVMAEYDGRIIGGALNFIGGDTLYGRNWGADLDIPCLHFEACYYQAIEFAIERGLRTVEAGAQGFHKVQRGYMPVTTWSAHWIAHDGFRSAVERFLDGERRGIDAEKNAIALEASPFRKG